MIVKFLNYVYTVSFMNVVVRQLVLCLELMDAYARCSISDGFGAQ
jgi:hypothetical protein